MIDPVKIRTHQDLTLIDPTICDGRPTTVQYLAIEGTVAYVWLPMWGVHETTVDRLSEKKKKIV